MTRVGVVVFPGSNCDRDTLRRLELAGAEPVELWHEQGSLDGVGAVVLPGGFAYGDYLRAGVIARFSPVMRAVSAFAAEGGLVLGICNGFQVLAEAGLVPGALLRNRGLRFLGRDVRDRGRAAGHAVHAPRRRGPAAAHADRPRRGLLLRRRRDARRAGARRPGPVPVRARRRPVAGVDGDPANPNGSLRAIAGVLNARGNVAGLMPHPERASEALLGSDDGLPILRSLVEAAGAAASALPWPSGSRDRRRSRGRGRADARAGDPERRPCRCTARSG